MYSEPCSETHSGKIHISVTQRVSKVAIKPPTSLYFPCHIKIRTPTLAREIAIILYFLRHTRNRGLCIQVKMPLLTPLLTPQCSASAGKFSNIVNVWNVSFLEPILHLSAYSCISLNFLRNY